MTRFIQFMGPISHIITALLIPLTAYAWKDIPFSWWMPIAAFVFGLLPDIDTTRSIIGRRTTKISKWLESTYGHRTVTHSLWPVAAILLLGYLTSFIGNWLWWMPSAMYASHLLLDMLIGKRGVPLIWPHPARFYYVKRFKAGGGAERVVTIAMIVIALTLVLSGIPDVNAAMQRATGSLDFAVAQYRDWQPHYQVLVEIEATDQETNKLIVGTYPVEKLTGSTFVIDVDGESIEAGQADQRFYIRKIIAKKGETIRPMDPQATETPTLIPTLVSLEIRNVHDMDEIMVKVGDTITKGQQVADLRGLRVLIMAPTPTATPTYQIILRPTDTAEPIEEPTPTPNIQPTQDMTEYWERVRDAEADLNLAKARATNAAAPIPIETIEAVCSPVDVSTEAEQVEQAHGQIHIAQLKIDELTGPPPIATAEACRSIVEQMRNNLWARQLSRDAQVQSDPDMTWTKQKALEAPLLETERQIAEKVETCNQLEQVQTLGNDIEIASAYIQMDAAILRLSAAEERYREATESIGIKARRCQELRSWPFLRSREAIQVSAAQLEVEQNNYYQKISTPKPIATWTPTKTPTVTPTPTPTPTQTPTPDISETYVQSPIKGDIHEITIGAFGENGAVVRMQVAVGYGQGAEAQPDTMPATVPMGTGTIQTLFTKTGIDIEAALIDRIDAGQISIDVALYEFNLDRVAEALIRAHRRGVIVRVKADDAYGIDEDHEEGHGQFAMMESAGIEIKEDRSRHLMHNKFFIIDSQTVWTGSTNITINGTQKNNNNVVIFNSQDIANIYQIEFDEMWRGEHGSKSPSTLDRQSANIDGIPVRIIFGPEDNGIDHLSRLVSEAKKEIRFMAFSYTHDTLGQAMAEASRRGIYVSGIFEKRGSMTEYSEMNLLHCDTSAVVRIDGNPRTFHHKVIVIDGRTVATGSFNFSKNANKNNDENMVLIESEEIAASYLYEFDRRWSEAEETEIVCN